MKHKSPQHKSLFFLSSLLIILLLVSMVLPGCEALPESMDQMEEEPEVMLEDGDLALEEGSLYEDGHYTSREDVGLYLHLYGQLPSNYITKSEAAALGWESSKGNLWEVTEQMSIGGDRFGNREGLLPSMEGRQYYECDINYEGGYRGAERIVYSNDGLVYYTPDHYASFELLYGEE